jgi:hypothetical protein
MGDLKTNFDKAVLPNMGDLGGDLPTSRGTDPNVDTGGSSALQTNFDKAINPSMDAQESANSVSGLPLQPNRFQPSEQPPEMPTLKDRMPGTIDKQ